MRAYRLRGFGLQACVERGHRAVARGVLRAKRFEQMRREIGQVARLGRQRFAQCEIEIERAEISRFVQAAQQEIAFGAQPLPIAREMHQRRIVGQHREGRGFGPRERVRITAEVPPGGGFEADDIAAERRVRGVQREDLVLAEGCLDAQGEHRFSDLVGETALIAAARQAGNLHGDRAAATDHAAGTRVQAERAGDGQSVDATMGVEPFVLEHQQRSREFCRHAGLGGEAPLPVARDTRAQQRTVARLEYIGLGRGEQPGRQQRPEPRSGRNRGQHRGGQDAAARQRCGETTSTHVPCDLACCLASYIASMLAPGR